MDHPFAGCASGQSWAVGAVDAIAVAPGREAAACYRRAIPVGKSQPLAVTVTWSDHQISFEAGKR